MLPSKQEYIPFEIFARMLLKIISLYVHHLEANNQ